MRECVEFVARSLCIAYSEDQEAWDKTDETSRELWRGDAQVAILATLQSLLEPVKALYPGYEGDDYGKGGCAMQSNVVDLINAIISDIAAQQKKESGKNV